MYICIFINIKVLYIYRKHCNQLNLIYIYLVLEGCGRRLSANEAKSGIACKQLLCVAQAMIARLETTLARTAPENKLTIQEYG